MVGVGIYSCDDVYYIRLCCWCSVDGWCISLCIICCVLMIGAGMYSCYGVYYIRVCCWCSVGVFV